ncbi:hypothetical protein BM527_16435 [Alteromonas sp. Mex14]|nr:hypothetical protein BM527_16435 [Alteromonas sp. Mex14]
MRVCKAALSSTICGFLSLPIGVALADQVFQDDVIIVGSACIGLDCSNGESFNFDSIRLKENNLRIKFQDTSSSASFPTVDWQLTANDSSNGGANYFAIDNVDSAQTPFKVMDGAKNNALFISSNSRVGFGTSTPVVNLHVVDGNSPAIRLEQDSSSGFSAQTWDVAGNETNFFVRDVTNASRIPFKIIPSAPSNSLFVAADGDIGFGTQTPDGIFDIAHPSDANDHALFISPTGNVGINIDNGFSPATLLDVQTTGGNSIFNITSSGNVGVGTSTPAEKLDVIEGRIAVGGAGSSFKVGARGVGEAFYLYNNDGSVLSVWNSANNHIFNIGNNGNLKIGENLSVTNSIHAIEHSNGAHLTAGGVWTNASSRELKKNIQELSYKDALEALDLLVPVTYEYLSEPSENYVGFIAEDVPSLVSMNDRKSLSSMDIIAVLTKIIKHQQESIESLNKRVK